MQKILSAFAIILFFSSCSNEMFPDKTLGQKSSNTKPGGVVYPDGSIHYPDGSVKTTDGMMWPASKNKSTSKSSDKNIANDPNVTVVSRSKTTNTTSSKKTAVKKSVPRKIEENEDTEELITINSPSSSERTFPGYDEEEPEVKKSSTNTNVNTSARKDASGRHARKRGEKYFRR